MKRISNEDGIQVGYRNMGRFALSMIPWALGLGLMVWVGNWVFIRDTRKTIAQEDRAAVYVAAEERPKEKAKIEVRDGSCLAKITRVDYEGMFLAMYVKNECGSVRYVEYHWTLLSPDHTALQSGWTNQCPVPAIQGDKAECRFDKYSAPTIDDRAATLRVWTEAGIR